MNFKINLGAWGSVFAVPSCVVDNYIKIADAKQLKVLLYLLKNSSAVMREEDVAAVTGLEPCDVSDAVLFWVNVGVLSESGGELSPAQGEPVREAAVPAARAEIISASARAKLSADTQFPPKEIASAVNGDSAVRYLFETFERLAGRPTKHAERNTLMVLIEEVKMPCEVAAMLVEYCFSVDKATPAYMKSTALEWCESGIDTIGKAEERIKILREQHSLENKLRSKYGVATAFSKKQKAVISGWTGFSDELIEEAYDRCMRNTGKMSLDYMDKILQGWANKGITTAEQAANDKKPESIGASFSVDELEQAAYAKYKKLGGGVQ